MGPGLAKAALEAASDGRVVGGYTELDVEGDVQLRLLTKRDPASLALMRHCCAQVMARAVMRLFEGVQLAFGPTIAGGFYLGVVVAQAGGVRE